MTGDQRGRAIRALGQLVHERAADLAALITSEQGALRFAAGPDQDPG